MDLTLLNKRSGIFFRNISEMFLCLLFSVNTFSASHGAGTSLLSAFTLGLLLAKNGVKCFL